MAERPEFTQRLTDLKICGKKSILFKFLQGKSKILLSPWFDVWE